ncbi:MAG: hypothetical protein NVS2B12_32000 [Ktedonobacteraceae bacterium]
MSKSEVARLRQQIELELDALRRGMFALSSGSARHAFINAKMERVGACQDVLASHIGQNDATMIVFQLYAEAMEPEQVPSDLS